MSLHGPLYKCTLQAVQHAYRLISRIYIDIVGYIYIYVFRPHSFFVFYLFIFRIALLYYFIIICFLGYSEG